MYDTAHTIPEPVRNMSGIIGRRIRQDLRWHAHARHAPPSPRFRHVDAERNDNRHDECHNERPDERHDGIFLFVIF